jgi:proton glutamate symport protein
MTTDGKNVIARTPWIKKPWAVLAFIVTGALFGYFFPDAGRKFSPLARIFIGLMQMCILPIMITAIISSLGRLIKSPGSLRRIKTLLIVFLAGILTASAVGIAAGLLGKPGSGLSQSAKASIGKMLYISEKTTAKTMHESVTPVSDFFVKMVPTNVFSALSEGNSLRILIFSLFLGIAIGLVPMPAGDQAIDIMNALFEAFKKIIGWIMYTLPFGLFCIFASIMATTGLDLFRSLVKFIVMIYLAAMLLFILYQLAIWKYTKVSLSESFTALRETYILALATANSFIALPSALIAAQKNLKMDEQTSNLIIPLGTVINRQGVVMCFSLTAVFLAQLYDIPLGTEQLIIILIGSALAGMASLGRLGVAVSTLAFVLDTIGAPLEVAFVVLFSIEVLADPLTAILIIQSNCATAAVVERYGKHHAEMV